MPAKLPPAPRTVRLREGATRPNSRIELGLNRLRQVFLELSDVSLSIDDAVRLTDLDPFLSQILLNALEDVRLVRRSGDGQYRRLATE